MKLFVLLVIAWLASACACAQQVSLSLHDAPFRHLLKSIQQQTDYTFVYSKEQLKLLPRVTLTAVDKNLFALLNEQLSGHSIGYTIDNKFIILYTKKHSGPDTIRTVYGRLINKNGQAVAGATVTIINEPLMAVTGADGSFSLQYTSDNATMQVSGAEIKPATITIGNSRFVEAVVDEQIKELDETIIVAYGQTTKRLNTGNVNKINFSGNVYPSNGNLLTALQGRVPGLLITATSGAPGASYKMQVRGQNSVNPNPLINNGTAPLDQPLIIIDGVPFAPQNNNINQFGSLASPGNLEIYNNPYGGICPLQTIDPSAIESVEVLKDADMTAIYGSRAANGIMLITTKQPRVGEIKLLLDISTGISTAIDKPAMLNTAEYLTIRKKAFFMDSIQPGAISGQINYAPDLLLFDTTRYTNWRKYFFRNLAPSTRVHASVSGGSKLFSFISAMSYRQESSLLKGNFYNNQFSVNAKVKYQSANNRVVIDAAVYSAQGVNRSISSPALFQAVNLPPNYPELIDGYGNLNWRYNTAELMDNPAGLLRQPYLIQTTNFIAHLNVGYEIAKGLNLYLSSGYSSFMSAESAMFPASALHPLERIGSYALFGENIFQTKLIEPQVKYRTRLGKMSITMLAGSTLQQNTISLLKTRGSHYSDETTLHSIDAAGHIDNRLIFEKYDYKGFFNRISILYAEKYLLNFSGRREGSSRFTNDQRFGQFGSLGAGWIFSEEKLIKRLSRMISFGKLRFSFGTSGNDNVGYQHYLQSWSYLPTYLGNPPLLPSNFSDTSFSWSTTHKTEAGLDLGFLDDRLSISLSRYRHKCFNQLISQLSPSQNNTIRYVSNFPASVENTGWEIIIGAIPLQSKKIKWACSFNIAIPKNKLISFPAVGNSLYAGIYFPDKSLGTLSVLNFTGVNVVSGLYEFDPDKYTLLDTYPQLYGGLQNSVSYNDFQCELSIEFKKHYGANYLRQVNHFTAGMAFNQSKPLQHFWQFPGDNALRQRLTAMENSPAKISSLTFPFSDAAYSDASYIRFRHFALSYSLPESLKRKIGLKKCRLYVQLQNFLTITSFDQSDPEIHSFYTYPYTSSFTVGIQTQL